MILRRLNFSSLVLAGLPWSHQTRRNEIRLIVHYTTLDRRQHRLCCTKDEYQTLVDSILYHMQDPLSKTLSPSLSLEYTCTYISGVVQW